MHGQSQKEINECLKVTEWDDLRRYNQPKNILPNERILDFGAGAGGFVLKA